MPKIEKVKKDGGYEPVKNTAVYCRISTSRSKQPSSLENQISGLITYVTSRYDLRLVGVYVDIESGRSANSRKELQRLLDDCEKGSVNQIVTKSVSRFGRNAVEVLRICRKLKGQGIDVYFLTEKMHSLDPSGELSITLAAAVAEGESYNKSENIRWGIAKSAADAASPLYSRPCYGYRLTEDGLAEVEEEAKVVRDIFGWYLSGMGTQAIKKRLEEEEIPSPTNKPQWAKRTIEKILCNEKYCGDVILYKTYVSEYPYSDRITNTGQRRQNKVENHHSPIISKDIFEQVQKAMKDRKRVTRINYKEGE